MYDTGETAGDIPSFYSTNKTDRHDITEILLKVALNIITQTLCVYSGVQHVLTI
jgi:hypothetical protein